MRSTSRSISMSGSSDSTHHVPDSIDVLDPRRLLLQNESAQTVRAWFVGMNPDLDDQSPAVALAEHPQEVLQAARAFLASE